MTEEKKIMDKLESKPSESKQEQVESPVVAAKKRPALR